MVAGLMMMPIPTVAAGGEAQHAVLVGGSGQVVEAASPCPYLARQAAASACPYLARQRGSERCPYLAGRNGNGCPVPGVGDGSSCPRTGPVSEAPPSMARSVRGIVLAALGVERSEDPA